MKQEFKIGNKSVGQGQPCFCVAEISGNHNGDFERAKEIVYAAKEAGADAIKLQTYTADSLAIDCNNEHFTLKGGLWDGMNLYQLYTQACTPYEWQPKLMELANSLGMECFSSEITSTIRRFVSSGRHSSLQRLPASIWNSGICQHIRLLRLRLMKCSLLERLHQSISLLFSQLE